MAMAYFNILMVTHIKGNGNSIKQMGKGSIIILMGLHMMENGWMICSMAMGLKSGMMVQDLKGFINLEKNMDKVH